MEAGEDNGATDQTKGDAVNREVYVYKLVSGRDRVGFASALSTARDATRLTDAVMAILARTARGARPAVARLA